MDDLKLVKLSDHDDRATTWKVADMLESAKKAIAEEPKWGKKAMLILLDDEGNYHTRTMCAGIGKNSEVIALLEIERHRQMREMD